jgi:hypothetical protein
MARTDEITDLKVVERVKLNAEKEDPGDWKLQMKCLNRK